ncbi:MAG: ABC transporter ATP-binding protein [Christensenellales bacterium]|jgi:ATP-binding cassette subfamily B multidrug efflux pump
MLKLARYLKPHIVWVLAIITLLFVQVVCDLSLPDYMSQIVNVGIQQGGMRGPVFEAMGEETFNKLLLLAGDEDGKTIEASYRLLDRRVLEQDEYDGYVEAYPALERENVFILNTQDSAEQDRLESILARSVALVAAMEGWFQSGDLADTDLSSTEEWQLPEGVDGFDAIAMLKQSAPQQYETLIREIHGKLDGVQDSLLNQAATGYVKMQYEALGIDVAGIQRSYMLNVGLAMLGVTLLGAACTIGVGFLAARVSAVFAMQVRRDVFANTGRFSGYEYDRFSTASLITRTTNDVTQVQMFLVIFLRMICYAPIMGVGGVIMAVRKSPQMSWTIGLAVGCLILLVVLIFSIALPKFKRIQTLVDKLNLVVRENLTGMMVIRAFNTQKFEEGRFDGVNQELTDTTLSVSRLMALVFPVMMLIMNAASLLIVWAGAQQIQASNLQVGDMMAFIQYAMQILMSFLMLSLVFIMWPRASVSASRIDEVLKTVPKVQDPTHAVSFDKGVRGSLEFRDVTFYFPHADDPALKNISFTAKSGQTTAIIGSTGSGKSAILKLITRFYDVSDGAILVNGVDIRKVTLKDLRDKVGYVPQKSVLFSGTVESNLKYGQETATRQVVESAANVAQAAEFVGQMPVGYESDIAQGGANVSGGQKQRLSIARALVKRPEIYLFDDSFSALDYKTDALVRLGLAGCTRNSVLVIVAQRINTIRNAEQILVLDNGEIVGRGTHDELMGSCKVYQEIAASQFVEEVWMDEQ